MNKKNSTAKNNKKNTGKISNSKKNTIVSVLELILIVIVIAIGVAGGDGLKAIFKKEKIAVKFDEDAVTEFSWNYGTLEYAFSKEMGSWVYGADPDLPIDQEKINSLISLVNKYTYSDVVKKPEDLAAYGLSEPKVNVHLKTSKKQYDISFGDTTSDYSQRYVSVGDGKVYISSKDVYNEYFVFDTDFVQVDEFPAMKNLKAFTISGANELTIEYFSKDAQSDKSGFYAVEKGISKAISAEKAKIIVKELTDISLEGYAAYKPTADDYKKFELDNPQMTVSCNYETFDGDDYQMIMHLTKFDLETVYAYFEGSDFVYELDTSIFDDFADVNYENLKAE